MTRASITKLISGPLLCYLTCFYLSHEIWMGHPIGSL